MSCTGEAHVTETLIMGRRDTRRRP
jgi:hypothetical protein